MRTVAAWTVSVPARMARARESLVFIATHFKLRSHVADAFFESPVPGRGARARLRRLQAEGRAASGRETAGPRALHHVPFDEHRLPAPAAAEGTRGVHG